MTAIPAPAPVRTQAMYAYNRRLLMRLFGDDIEPTSAYYHEQAPAAWLALPINVPGARDVAPVEKPRRKRTRKALKVSP